MCLIEDDISHTCWTGKYMYERFGHMESTALGLRRCLRCLCVLVFEPVSDNPHVGNFRCLLLVLRFHEEELVGA